MNNNRASATLTIGKHNVGGNTPMKAAGRCRLRSRGYLNGYEATLWFSRNNFD